jgi:hypothetical protein
VADWRDVARRDIDVAAVRLTLLELSLAEKTCTCRCGSCRGLHGQGHCYIWGFGCRLRG